MSDEPMNLAEVGQYTAFQKAWKGFMSLLDVEEPPGDNLFEFITQFKEALKWGEKYLASRPQDEEVQNMVKQLHDSLRGLGDIDHNQWALLFYWHGYHFYALVMETSGIGFSMMQELLEHQTIRSLNKALQLAPDYPAAQEVLQLAQGLLLSSQAASYVTREAETEKVVGLIEGSDKALDYCTEAGNSNYRGKIQRTTEYIDKMQLYLAGMEENAIPYEVRKICEYDLAALYLHRGIAKWMLGNGPKDKDMLKSALSDLDKAARFPDDCIRAVDKNPADFRSAIQLHREKINARLGGCFIATAAYGSPLAVEVEFLRQYRDTVLRQTRLGRQFIRIYERCSPPLADWIAVHPATRNFTRRFLLTPIIKLIQFAQGMEVV